VATESDLLVAAGLPSSREQAADEAQQLLLAAGLPGTGRIRCRTGDAGAEGSARGTVTTARSGSVLSTGLSSVGSGLSLLQFEDEGQEETGAYAGADAGRERALAAAVAAIKDVSRPTGSVRQGSLCARAESVEDMSEARRNGSPGRIALSEPLLQEERQRGIAAWLCQMGAMQVHSRRPGSSVTEPCTTPKRPTNTCAAQAGAAGLPPPPHHPLHAPLPAGAGVASKPGPAGIPKLALGRMAPEASDDGDLLL